MAARSHGRSRTPLYRIWGLMLHRCRNTNDPGYGGRGITVCSEWESFERFYADMGERPSSGHQLDRIDNDGPYAPWNCRWATRSEQARNRRDSHHFEHEGEVLPLVEWADRFGMKRSTLAQRVYSYRWSIERALTTPVRSRGGGLDR